MRFLTTILISLLTVFASAEDYSIHFSTTGTNNDGGGVTEAGKIVAIASDNMVVAAPIANRIYRGKLGYGIKGGTGSDKGELKLVLDQTYYPTTITVYAATWGTDTKTISVNGQTITWDSDKTNIHPYTIAVSAAGLDTIHIVANTKSNNRYYVQKIEFTCEDPNPTHAKLTMPASLAFASEPFIQNEPVEDMESMTVTARCVDANGIHINMKKGTFFHVYPSTLPADGGDITITYSDTLKSKATMRDSVIVTAQGADGLPIRKSVSVQVTFYDFTPKPVDSTGMVIGPFRGSYYDTIQGLKDSVLKSTLASRINCGVRYRYGSGTHKTWDAFYHTDRDTTTNKVLDMYSSNLRYFDSENSTASVADFDIEHMFPKSWWGGSVNNAYLDLFHLVPGDYSANRSKSNHGPGIPTDTTFWNGSFATGADTVHHLNRVFCPADEYKGDFARAYFYIACCYGDELSWIQDVGSEPLIYLSNTDWHEFRPWVTAILLDWHRMDPVSEKEKARAIEVNKIQGNRNPFIDYPELVEYIWGYQQGNRVDLEQLTPSFPQTPTCIPETTKIIKVVKVLQNGQLLIRLDDKTYNIFGQEQ